MLDELLFCPVGVLFHNRVVAKVLSAISLLNTPTLGLLFLCHDMILGHLAVLILGLHLLVPRLLSLGILLELLPPLAELVVRVLLLDPALHIPLIGCTFEINSN
eukprot:37989-Pyramimonas_sp.AAC.1